MSNDNFEAMLNKIHHSEAMVLLSRLPDRSIHMILADLPYGTTQAFYDSIIPLEPLWKQLRRVIEPNGAIVLTATQPFSSMLVSSNMKMFKYEWVWRKRRKTNFLNAKIMPLTGHEVVLIFAHSMPNYYPQMKPSSGHKTGAKRDRGSILYGDFNGDYFGQRQEYYPDTVIEFGHDPSISTTYAQNKNKRTNHPNQKPVRLFEYLIKSYTLENEIVLDMVCGSGTTAIAARKYNRQFICGDSHLPYVESARERLQNTDPYRATVNKDGSTQMSLFDKSDKV